MAKISKTARASGATGIKKSSGPARSRQRCQKRRRAHKRDSTPAQPIGGGRDARKAAKRKARAELIAGLIEDTIAMRHEEALAEDVELMHEAALAVAPAEAPGCEA